MDFSDILQQKLRDIEDAQQNLRNAVLEPTFHVNAMEEAIASIIPEIDALENDPELLRDEFKSVLSQIPAVVGSAWSGPVQRVSFLESEKVRWQEMLGMYKEWEAAQDVVEELPEQAEELVTQTVEDKISSGEITEPTKESARKRPPGTKPPITLGNFRKISSKLQSGEDSEG